MVTTFDTQAQAFTTRKGAKARVRQRLADITGTPAMPRTVALQATFRY